MSSLGMISEPVDEEIIRRLKWPQIFVPQSIWRYKERPPADWRRS